MSSPPSSSTPDFSIVSHHSADIISSADAAIAARQLPYAIALLLMFLMPAAGHY